MGYVLVKAAPAAAVAVPFVARAGMSYLPLVAREGGKHVVGGAARTVGGGAMTTTAASSVPAIASGAGKVGVSGAAKTGATYGLPSFGLGRMSGKVGNQQSNQQSNLTEKDERYGQLAAETRQMLRDKASTNPTQFS